MCSTEDNGIDVTPVVPVYGINAGPAIPGQPQRGDMANDGVEVSRLT